MKLMLVTMERFVKNNSEMVCIFGLVKNKRVCRYCESNKILKGRENIGKWKIFVPKTYGSGLFSEAPTNPILGAPGSICTETFIMIGPFDTGLEATNAMKYLQTGMLKCLVGIKKLTQDALRKVYSHVPLQDFTENSDIDWSGSIEEIDMQLFKKYNLSKEEIQFIKLKSR